MPAIQAPAKVLVTGASGFIAVWVCKTLLEAGYTVRGTVRSAGKGDYLKDLFKSHSGKFEYVIVKDMAEDGAFDEAVEGIDAVAHTASPVTFETEDPQAVIVPAVKGTIGILKSIQEHAPGVQRVVITSSAATILDTSKPTGTIYTENDWNISSLKEVEEKGKDAAGVSKYRASKILAEKAAWAEVESKKPTWDLATINPPMASDVFGPILQQVEEPSSLNMSVARVYKILQSKEEDLSKDTVPADDIASSAVRTELFWTLDAIHMLNTPSESFVDVRDVALAHVRALEVPEAGGQRFIVASGPYCWQDVLDILPLPHPRGTPGSGKSLKHSVFSADKARNVLGIDFKKLDEVIKDTEEGLRKRVWGRTA
ncbi:D-lactaldehyde dehydrogenase [Ceratobasidium sp. AG-I]|nr:D-lactaldehyde dehydrogenase [Ceratobasidium sp. AG-I]